MLIAISEEQSDGALDIIRRYLYGKNAVIVDSLEEGKDAVLRTRLR